MSFSLKSQFGFAIGLAIGLFLITGCGSKPDKAVVEKILHAKKDLVKELAELEKRCAEIKAQLAERAEKEQK